MRPPQFPIFYLMIAVAVVALDLAIFPRIFAIQIAARSAFGGACSWNDVCKGRDGIGAFFLGFLIGPLGLLIVLLRNRSRAFAVVLGMVLSSP